MNISKWVIPDNLRAMPFHRPAPDSVLYKRLVEFIAWELERDKSNDGPILLWMPEWLNLWVWQLWAWQRRLRNLPVTE